MGRCVCGNGNNPANVIQINQPLRRKVDSSGSFPSAATLEVEAARYPQRGSGNGGGVKLLLCHRNKAAVQQQEEEQQQHLHHEHYSSEHRRCTWQSLACASNKQMQYQRHIIEPQNAHEYHGGRYQSFPHPSLVGFQHHHQHRRRHSWASSSPSSSFPTTTATTSRGGKGGGNILTRNYLPVQHSTSAMDEVEDSWDSTETNNIAAALAAAAAAAAASASQMASQELGANQNKQITNTRQTMAELEDEDLLEDEFTIEAMKSLQKRAQAIREKAAVLESKHHHHHHQLSSPERTARSTLKNHHGSTPTSTKTTSTCASSSHSNSSTPPTPSSSLPAKATWAVVPATVVHHRAAAAAATSTTQLSKHSASSPRLTRVPTAPFVPRMARAMDAHGTLPPLHPNSGYNHNNNNNNNRDDDDDDDDDDYEGTSESTYSSEFMTDDSSETSGLPVDTSTSISNDEAGDQQPLLPPLQPLNQPSALNLGGAPPPPPPRIGIRPIELPPVLRRTVGHAGQAFYQHRQHVDGHLPVSSGSSSIEDVEQEYNTVPDPLPIAARTTSSQFNHHHHIAAAAAPKIKKSSISKTTMVPNTTTTRKSHGHHHHLASGWQSYPPESFINTATIKRNSSARSSDNNKSVVVVGSSRQGRQDETSHNIKQAVVVAAAAAAAKPPLGQDLSAGATINVAAATTTPAAAAQKSASTSVTTTTTTPTRSIRGRASSCSDAATIMNLYIPKATRSERGEHFLYNNAEQEEDRSIASTSLHSSNEASPFRPVAPRSLSNHDLRLPPVHHHQHRNNSHTAIHNQPVVHSSNNIHHQNQHAIPFVTSLTRQATTSGLSQSSRDNQHEQRKSYPDPPAEKMSVHRNVQHDNSNNNNNGSSSPPIPILSSHHHHLDNLEGGREMDPSRQLWSYDDKEDDDDAPSIQRATSMKSVPASNKMMALISKFEDFGKAQAVAATATTPPPNKIAPRRALNYNIAMLRRENRQDSFSQGSASSSNNTNNNSRDGGDNNSEVAAANQQYAVDHDDGHAAAATNQYAADDDGHDASRGTRAVPPATSVPRGYFWRTSPEPFNHHHHHRGGAGGGRGQDEVRDELPLDPDLAVVPSTSTNSTLGDHYFDSRHQHQHHQDDAYFQQNHHGTVRSKEQNHHFMAMTIDPKSNNNNNWRNIKNQDDDMRNNVQNKGHIFTPSLNPRYLHV